MSHYLACNKMIYFIFVGYLWKFMILKDNFNSLFFYKFPIVTIYNLMISFGYKVVKAIVNEHENHSKVI